jgi:putative transcription factor
MPACDMCGKTIDRIYKTMVEGVLMDLCDDCSKFGEVVSERNIMNEKYKKKKEAVKEAKENKIRMQKLVDNYGKLIRDKRERKGLKQEELAKKLNEKESLIKNIEKGHIEPSLKTARKIEAFLKIKLIEEVELDESVFGKNENGGDELTLGDVIKG